MNTHIQKNTSIRARVYGILFLNRISFLTPKEKILLVAREKDHTLQELIRYIKSCSIYDWRRLLGRNIKESSWNKKKLLHIQRGVEHDICWAQHKKGMICTIESPYYPPLLTHIEDPPLVLFVRGNVHCLQHTSISIVGTRKPNSAGRKISFLLGRDCVAQGINVVSGFAYGIDIESHKGMIYAHSTMNLDLQNTERIQKNNSIRIGVPIVVLGTSIDTIYPKVHTSLSHEILVKGGVLMSEIPPGQESYKNNFIGRNRIISGLSMNIIVVQAPKKSGALATADFALQQGRTLWVHEVGLTSEYEGTYNLWREGALIWHRC